MQRDALRTKQLVWLLIVPALGWGVSARAQAPSAELRVATATGATTFHIGERISLQLDFTAKPEAHLAVTTRGYDRSGRLNIESFEVSPSSGFSDPLEAYFNGGVFMGGGLFNVEELSRKPYTMRVNLNEWVRFDTPGDYTVTVHSGRVFWQGKAEFSGDAIAVTSNAIKLHIIAATPEWQKATLERALKALPAKYNIGTSVPDAARDAITDIRFLGTAEAVKVMAGNLGEDQGDRAGDFTLGLVGLPPSMQDAAKRALRERIDDPDVALSGNLMEALTILDSKPAGSPKEAMEARAAAEGDVVQLAVAALPRKTDKAKAATADVLLREDSTSLTSEDKAVIAQALAPTFTELSDEKQAILLEYQWGVVRSAISTEALAKIASMPLENPHGQDPWSSEQRGLKNIALKRWYEVDPKAATRAVYAEIGSENPSLPADRLRFLPAKPLPQFESTWAQALLSSSGESNQGVLAGLMTRFGTGRFAPQVATKIRASLSEENCGADPTMLAYVIKFNSEVARPLLAEVMAEGRGKECNRGLFLAVAHDATGPALTESAIKSVDDSDPELAIDALEYLKAYGDERSEKKILNRYRTWAEEWAGREAELESSFLKPSPNEDQKRLGKALGLALLANQGWIADDKLTVEVLKGCVGEQMCNELQHLAGPVSPPYLVQVVPNEDGGLIQVGPYDIPNLDLLKAKLAQYPRGAAFQLFAPDFSADEKLQQQVRAVFNDAGMTLTEKR